MVSVGPTQHCIRIPIPAKSDEILALIADATSEPRSNLSLVGFDHQTTVFDILWAHVDCSGSTDTREPDSEPSLLSLTEDDTRCRCGINRAVCDICGQGWTEGEYIDGVFVTTIDDADDENAAPADKPKGDAETRSISPT